MSAFFLFIFKIYISFISNYYPNIDKNIFYLTIIFSFKKLVWYCVSQFTVYKTKINYPENKLQLDIENDVQSLSGFFPNIPG